MGEFMRNGERGEKGGEVPHSPADPSVETGRSAAVLFIAGDSHTLPFRPTPGVVIPMLQSLDSWQAASQRPEECIAGHIGSKYQQNINK